MALVIGPAQPGQEDEIHAFYAPNYVPKWHNCSIPPWFSKKELPGKIADGLVWTAREDGTLVAVVNFIYAPDGAMTMIAFFCSAERGIDLCRRINLRIKASRNRKIRLPEIPDDLKADCERIGFVPRGAGGLEA